VRNHGLDPDDLERVRTAVEQRLGLTFDDATRQDLVDAVHARLAATGARTARDYAARLGSDASGDELRALAERVTVGETCFFRTPDHFRALADLVLPARARARVQAGGEPLRLLSAGCATGEEPYTIAIVVRETPAVALARVAIEAFDVNASFLEAARLGRYGPWKLRATPAAARGRWFREEGGGNVVLDEGIRRTVSFGRRNLVDDDPAFYRPGSFDAIFCRNVMIYFSPETTRAIVARFARALAPGGYLFLGHAESLRGVSDAFDLIHADDAFFYRLRDPAAGPAATSFASGPAAHGESPPEATAPPAGSWFDEIGRSSERIAALAGEGGEGGERAGRGQGQGNGQGSGEGERMAGDPVDAVLDLVRAERFGEALNRLDALPPDVAASARADVLKAAVAACAGDLAAAEAAARRALVRDPHSGGAHYLAGLCRELAADAAAAAVSYRAAARAEPSFAMPRLRHGLLSRRTGDLATARRELLAAQDLLAVESAERLLLFGGGFGRRALADLCAAELKAAGAGGR